MPLKNLTFERHLFHTRKQGRSESINSFVTDLKNIARKCEFGDLGRDLIKDRIVCGIQSDAVRKILRETGLTLEKALSICNSSELSEQQVKNLADNEDVHEVSSLRSNESRQDKRIQRQLKKSDSPEQTRESTGAKVINKCRNCGGKHMPKQCPAFGKTCHNCNKKNHFARVCLKGKQSLNRSTYEVDDDELFIGTVEIPIPEKEAGYKVQNLSTKVENVPQVEAVESRNDEWYSTLKLGEHLVKLKLDNGAKYNVLPKHLFNKITQGQQEVGKSNTKLISYLYPNNGTSNYRVFV